jgi:hypothetical protein
VCPARCAAVGGSALGPSSGASDVRPIRWWPLDPAGGVSLGCGLWPAGWRRVARAATVRADTRGIRRTVLRAQVDRRPRLLALSLLAGRGRGGLSQQRADAWRHRCWTMDRVPLPRPWLTLDTATRYGWGLPLASTRACVHVEFLAGDGVSGEWIAFWTRDVPVWSSSYMSLCLDGAPPLLEKREFAVCLNFCRRTNTLSDAWHKGGTRQ